MMRCLILLVLALTLNACRSHGNLADYDAGLTVVTRADWGSSPRPLSTADRHQLRQITIHHAGVVWKDTDNPYTKIKGLQTFGQNEKEWPDLPYHYLIAPDGRIFEGRPLTHAGETNTKYNPRGHALVMLWGNFEVQAPSKAQLNSAVQTCAWLCKEYDLKPLELSGHVDQTDGTVCPGENLQSYIKAGLIQKWVQGRLAGMQPEIKLLPVENKST